MWAACEARPLSLNSPTNTSCDTNLNPAKEAFSERSPTSTRNPVPPLEPTLRRHPRPRLAHPPDRRPLLPRPARRRRLCLHRDRPRDDAAPRLRHSLHQRHPLLRQAAPPLLDGLFLDGRLWNQGLGRPPPPRPRRPRPPPGRVRPRLPHLRRNLADYHPPRTLLLRPRPLHQHRPLP